MKPVEIVIKGKGPLKILDRAKVISSRYGFTSAKMERTLAHFASLLNQFKCTATFPITASTLARSSSVIKKLQERGIEFAVHGYSHIDHTHLSFDEQLVYFERARQIFEKFGLSCHGFRSPYLRWSEETIAAVVQSGFLYEGSQGLTWDVMDGNENDSYHRALNLYGAISAENYPALPRLENGLVHIPYCLPDDEALVDRFQLDEGEALNGPWLAILDKAYSMGELFTLGLHPERIHLCDTALAETLRKAQSFTPTVWIARLDEVAFWWKDRTESAKNAVIVTGDEIFVCVNGPFGVTLLTRGMETKPSGLKWDDGYHRVPGNELTFRCDRRPFIGVSPSSSPGLVSFLNQQGYIVEITENENLHTFFIDRPNFSREDERSLLALIEENDFPLVRLGRWPNGARSALSITGDIDALTIWDYFLRFLGQ